MQNSIGAVKSAGLPAAPQMEKSCNIQLVKNGYVISPSWPGKPSVAKTLNEMLAEVQEFFEDKPDQQ